MSHELEVESIFASGLIGCPCGEHVNYFLQKYVARTLPIRDAGFDDHVHYARHISMRSADIIKGR